MTKDDLDKQRALSALGSGLSLGGFLTSVMESQMLSRHVRGVGRQIGPERGRAHLHPLPTAWESLASALEMGFESEGESLSIPQVLREGPSRELPDYSLEPLNSLFSANRARIPVLSWNVAFLEKVVDKLSGLGDKLLSVHFRQPETTASSFGLAFASLVRKLVHDESLEKYLFIVLGDNIPHELVKHPRVFFARGNGWSLEEQLVASTQTSCFLGEASGFCTAAIFSHAPYLIYKDPDQHTGTVDRDIGPGGKILFSNDSQLFLREVPTSQDAATKIVDLIATSHVGNEMGRPGNGVENST